MFQLLVRNRLVHHPRMPRESSRLAHRVIEQRITGWQSLKGEHLAARLRAYRDAIRDRVTQ
jgi:hypothetical protein